VIGLTFEEISFLIDQQPKESSAKDSRAQNEPGDPINQYLTLIKPGNPEKLKAVVAREIARKELELLIIETIAPLIVRVGEEWLSGTLSVYDEHFFTECITQVLRQARWWNACSRSRDPRAFHLERKPLSKTSFMPPWLSKQIRSR
jgi:hypothetical protein